jgi:hypothetical protein
MMGRMYVGYTAGGSANVMSELLAADALDEMAPVPILTRLPHVKTSAATTPTGLVNNFLIEFSPSTLLDHSPRIMLTIAV